MLAIGARGEGADDERTATAQPYGRTEPKAAASLDLGHWPMRGAHRRAAEQRRKLSAGVRPCGATVGRVTTSCLLCSWRINLATSTDLGSAGGLGHADCETPYWLAGMLRDFARIGQSSYGD